MYSVVNKIGYLVSVALMVYSILFSYILPSDNDIRSSAAVTFSWGRRRILIWYV